MSRLSSTSCRGVAAHGVELMCVGGIGGVLEGYSPVEPPELPPADPSSPDWPQRRPRRSSGRNPSS